MNTRIQHVILIDPVARTVRAVESDGTIEHFQALIGAEYLEILRVNDGDMLLFDESPAPDDAPFAIGAGTIVRGRAIIAYGGNVVMHTPKLPLNIAQEVITFSPTNPNPE